MIPQKLRYHRILIWQGFQRFAFLHRQQAKEMKTKKIDREFLLSDSTINCYGFRLMTDGYLIDEFKKNPIGYYMHNREDGVIVKWEDLRVDGDKVYGKPVINLSNDRGAQCVDEIENGFLNGASVGHIVALEWSEDPKDMLPGQTGPTITRWYNRECSVCDVPGNMNALALYDKEGHVIKLADFKTQTNKMEKIFFTPEQLVKMGLKADSKQADVDTAIDNLKAEAAKVPGLQTQLTAAQTEKTNAVNELNVLKASTVKKEVEDLLQSGLDKKLYTVEMQKVLAVQYAGKPVELKALIDTMKPFESVTTTLKAVSDTDKTELDGLVKLTGEQLFQQGKFERLKALNADQYKIKYKEYFGSEPAEEKK
jgi:hypothetical protein